MKGINAIDFHTDNGNMVQVCGNTLFVFPGGCTSEPGVELDMLIVLLTDLTRIFIMSKENVSFEIPATFEMTVWLKDDDKGLIGKASVTFSSGKYPTKKEIQQWIKRQSKKPEWKFVALTSSVVQCLWKELGKTLLYLEKTCGMLITVNAKVERIAYP